VGGLSDAAANGWANYAIDSVPSVTPGRVGPAVITMVALDPYIAARDCRTPRRPSRITAERSFYGTPAGPPAGLFAGRCPRYRVRVTQQEHRAGAGGLPPLAPPEASEAERNAAIVARFVARHGPPSLEDYRRVYAAQGLEWPGDDEVRRRHPVASPAA